MHPPPRQPEPVQPRGVRVRPLTDEERAQLVKDELLSREGGGPPGGPAGSEPVQLEGSTIEAEGPLSWAVRRWFDLWSQSTLAEQGEVLPELLVYSADGGLMEVPDHVLRRAQDVGPEAIARWVRQQLGDPKEDPEVNISASGFKPRYKVTKKGPVFSPPSPAPPPLPPPLPRLPF